MFRRFHHGHSAAGGFVLALALIGHTLWIVTAAVVVGVVIGRAWAVWARVTLRTVSIRGAIGKEGAK